MKECPFCNIDKNKIENTILEEFKYFYITPSLGSLVDGYILIISKRHVNSMSELEKEEMEEYKFIVDEYREIFKSIYKKHPIVFEHGTPNKESEMKASSIVHAHTHIVNHNYINEKDMICNLNFKKINSLNDFRVKDNYLFYIGPKNQMYISQKFDSISQIMRIEIAKDLGDENIYDWRKNDFKNNMISTIKAIKNYNKKSN